MNTVNPKPTYKEQFLRFFGYIYIKPNHVGIIFQNSCFSHFLESGWHPRLSWWDQRLVAQIPIIPHLAKLEMEVQSDDGFLFDLAISISFTFNPAQAAPEQWDEAANIVLSPNPNKFVREQILRQAQYGARQIIGSYMAEALLCGHIRSHIEREIRHYLQSALIDLGVLIQPCSGILIEALTPPAVVNRVKNTHYQQRKTIELLEQHPETALQTFLLDSLTQQNNVMVFNNRNRMQSLIEQLYADAFNNRRPHPHTADDYQAADVVLPNDPIRANGKYQREVIS